MQKSTLVSDGPNFTKASRIQEIQFSDEPRDQDLKKLANTINNLVDEYEKLKEIIASY